MTQFLHVARATKRLAVAASCLPLLAAAAPTTAAAPATAQALTPFWEDLTGLDFARAIKEAQGVCILPFGSVEEFGPAGPLGTNLYYARMIAAEAAKREYAVIFPPYFAAQTTDVSNHQGTIAYSSRLLADFLEETVSEMARNGCTKVVISNGHSGNMGLLQNFIAASNARPHDYVVYSTYPSFPHMEPGSRDAAGLPAAMMPSRSGADGHGGEERLSMLMAGRPDLVHPERSKDLPSGPNGVPPLPLPSGQGGVMVGVARAVEVPTSYQGDASGANAARGRALLDYAAGKLVQALRAIKADKQSAQAQRTFDAQRAHPAP